MSNIIWWPVCVIGGLWIAAPPVLVAFGAVRFWPGLALALANQALVLVIVAALDGVST